MAVLGGMGNCDLKREERYLVSTKQHETFGAWKMFGRLSTLQKLNELQQKKNQLKTLDTYCVYEKKKLNAFDINLHELSIYKSCSISPTPPPFGVTNSINERFFKNVFFLSC